MRSRLSETVAQAPLDGELRSWTCKGGREAERTVFEGGSDENLRQSWSFDACFFDSAKSVYRHSDEIDLFLCEIISKYNFCDWLIKINTDIQ